MRFEDIGMLRNLWNNRWIPVTKQTDNPFEIQFAVNQLLRNGYECAMYMFCGKYYVVRKAVKKDPADIIKHMPEEGRVHKFHNKFTAVKAA